MFPNVIFTLRHIATGYESITYDDNVSIARKADYIISRGYGGAMIWSVDLEDFRGICGPANGLIQTIRHKMENYIPPTK